MEKEAFLRDKARLFTEVDLVDAVKQRCKSFRYRTET